MIGTGLSMPQLQYAENSGNSREYLGDMPILGTRILNQDQRDQKLDCGALTHIDHLFKVNRASLLNKC